MILFLLLFFLDLHILSDAMSWEGHNITRFHVVDAYDLNWVKLECAFIVKRDVLSKFQAMLKSLGAFLGGCDHFQRNETQAFFFFLNVSSTHSLSCRALPSKASLLWKINTWDWVYMWKMIWILPESMDHTVVSALPPFLTAVNPHRTHRTQSSNVNEETRCWGVRTLNSKSDSCHRENSPSSFSQAAGKHSS